MTEDQRADLLGGIRASQGKQDDPKTTEEETKREDVAAAFVRKILPRLPADCVRFQDMTRKHAVHVSCLVGISHIQKAKSCVLFEVTTFIGSLQHDQRNL